MTSTDRRPALWQHIDDSDDSAFLWAAGAVDDVLPADVIAVLETRGLWLTADAARGLRDALHRVLAEGGGGADSGYRQSVLEGAQALHGVHHRQLEAAARRFAEHVDAQVNAVARLVDQVRAVDTGRPDAVRVLAELMHVLAVQQQRTACSLADLLSAIGGES